MIKKLLYISIPFIIINSFSVVGQGITFTSDERQWINNHPVIEFGYEPSWGPYEIYENGAYIGIVGEYVKIIENKTGIDMVPIPNITWEESLEGLKNGTINMAPCCAITAERRTYLEFTDIYINDPIVIVTRMDYEFIGELSDLNNKTIVLPKSYYTKELISKDFPAINITEKDGIIECLEELSYGKVDAFVGNLGVISYHINHKGFTNLKIAAPTTYKNNGIALAVTKDWVIFRDIAQKVFNSITPLEKSTLRQDWISVRYEHGYSWKTTRIWISAISAIFILILLIFIIWNRTLKKQIILRKETEKELNHSLEKIRKQDSEKEILLQEIHHRVKNNLQIITSLLRLQSNTSSDQNVITSLNNATERIRTISLIHEKIYSSSNLGEITIIDYVNSLAKEIISSVSRNHIDLKVISDIKTLNLKSIVPLALILNELLTNSIEYGLKDKIEGEIRIEFTLTDCINLKYFDNGTWISNEDSDFFGTTLIEVFTEQLEGKYLLNKTSEGTEYIFNFKEIF
jgi:two-component sensor histidine kinase/ABC-type amino acid transport substrate-binding protein